MKSLQDYINTYRNIASNLNIRGDSAEVLIQLLANASYISEVENIAYSQEASIERASLMNSKIQHCVNSMHSVFRGLCPRVILNIKPLKYFSLNPFDEIIVGNTYKLYYIGYYSDESNTGVKNLSYDTGINYSSLTLTPDIDINIVKPRKIVCILAKDVVNIDWELTSDNTYYVDCIEEGLSNDLWVKVDGSRMSVTTQFSEHLLNRDIFDLTLPSFGSRLYVAGTKLGEDGVASNYPTSTVITAQFFKYSNLSSYNESDLKKINLKGAELIKADDNDLFFLNRGLTQFIPGVFLVKETEKDQLISTHYKANQSRYTNTIIKSNTDLGDLLEKTYPSKIYTGGTKSAAITEGNNRFLYIYYIPTDYNQFLTDDEIESFVKTRAAYYIVDNIVVRRGNEYSATFDIEVELYQNESVTSEIEDILKSYERKFDINFLNTSEGLTEDQLGLLEKSSIGEIETLISKISNVKKVKNIDVTYYIDGTQINQYSSMAGDDRESISDVYQDMINAITKGSAYFKINQQIKSII